MYHSTTLKEPLKRPHNEPPNRILFSSLLDLEFDKNLTIFFWTFEFCLGSLGFLKDLKDKSLTKESNFVLLTKHPKPVVDGDNNNIAIGRQGRAVVQVSAERKTHCNQRSKEHAADKNPCKETKVSMVTI